MRFDTTMAICWFAVMLFNAFLGEISAMLACMGAAVAHWRLAEV